MGSKIIGICYFGVDEPRAQIIQTKAQALGYIARFGDKNVPVDWYQGCEVIFGMPKPSEIAGLSDLRWLQTGSAGIEGYLRPGILPEGVLLTNASGAYGIGIAEHMLTQLLMMFKQSEGYLLQQRESLWKSRGRVKMIYGSVITVVGLGDIGGEFAQRVHAMGAHVRGVKRTMSEKPTFVDELYTNDQLDAALDGADVIALCLPGTFATTGILSKDRIDCLKEGAVILNVGRGTAIDQDAMIAALQRGHLGGVGLDVTTPEPLPSDNPLWTLPGVVLSPHISGGTSSMITVDKVIGIFLANLEDYAAGRPFKRNINRVEGY